MPMPLKNVPPKPCEHCGGMMERKMFSGRMEDSSIFAKRRFCNRQCMAGAMMKSPEELTRRGLLGRARLLLKSACERCGTKQKLSIHHYDRNWRNNSPENLITLCSSCHTKLHHETGDIVKRLTPKSCPICAKQFAPTDSRALTCSRSCGWMLRKLSASAERINCEPTATVS